MKTGRNADTKPYLPLFVDDWFSSPRVRVMSMNQRCAFLELLMMQWRDGSVQTDIFTLERLFPDASPEELKEVAAAFPEGRNTRLERVREAANEQQRIRSESARKANGVRWHSGRSPSGSNAEAEAEAEAKKKNKAAPPALVLPSSLEPARTAIDSWLAYKAEKGKRYKNTGLKALITKLEAWGPSRTSAAIQHSMASGWDGLFEQTESKNANSVPKSLPPLPQYKPLPGPRIAPPPNLMQMLEAEKAKASRTGKAS